MQGSRRGHTRGHVKDTGGHTGSTQGLRARRKRTGDKQEPYKGQTGAKQGQTVVNVKELKGATLMLQR